MPVSSGRLDRYVPAVQLFAARLVLFHAVVAGRLGLSPTEFKCFRLIEQLGPLSLTTLAHEAGLQLGTASELVDRLEKAGLVSRRRDAVDKRRNVLLASPDAAGRISGFYREHGQAMSALLESFAPRDFTTILRFLDEAGAVLSRSHADLIASSAAEAIKRQPAEAKLNSGHLRQP